MIHSIRSKNLEIKVKSTGAELSSVRDLEGYEFMWHGGEEWPKHAPNLFPIVGALKHNTYLHQGEFYHLNRHGFARDKEFECIEKTDTSLVFSLKSSEETLKVYPFSFEFRIVYHLDRNQLAQTFEVYNPGDEVLYASFGGHPAFAADPIDHCSLILDSKETLSAHILDGNLIGNQKVEGFVNGRLHLTKTTFDQDALIFTDLKSKEVSLKHQSNEKTVKLGFADFPYLGIWSKPGASFVCIEPWQGLADFIVSNQILMDKTGMVQVNPGSYDSRTFYMEFCS
jgi:galactose mutarotase-like enzyme